MLDFEIGGCTPFKFIVSTLSDVSLWSLIFGGFIIILLLRFLHKLGIFRLLGLLICFVFDTIKKAIIALWFVISQSYMMIMFHLDSAKNNYNSAEYWATRKLTVAGIKAVDSTGTQPLLIKHVKAVDYIILSALIVKRVVGNILYRVYSTTKH